MTNTVNIVEVLLVNIADSTHAVNLHGPTQERKSVYQPRVVRVTDHVDDDGGVADYTDGMALFTSVRHGEPWCKNHNVLDRVVFVAGGNPASPASPLNVTDLFPNHDYTDFE